MSLTTDSAAATPEPPWWSRLHAALMPDYNRGAAAYWWAMIGLGSLLLGHALATLLALPSPDLVQVGAGVAIAMLAGLFPVRIPGSKNSFAAGEIFIFLLLLMHGPAAAALAATGEGFLGAWRTSKRWTSRIVSPATACVAMFGVGSLLDAALATCQTLGWAGPELLLGLTMAAAVLYFIVNTLLITAIPNLKRKHWPSLRETFDNFAWVGITFAGSAAVAGLLFLSFGRSGLGGLAVAAPIIAMLLSTLHYHFRQRDADEAARKASADAAQRESEQAARHMRELQLNQAELRHIAFHDSLTELPNRRRFQELLEQALARAKTRQGHPFGVMFIDFDRFKLINDSLGHAVGDEFLVAVARRIQGELRPGDVVARLGGDEFAILAEDIGNERYCVRLAERLLDALRQPVHLGGTEINSSASIGITFSSMGYETPAEMLRDADTAMYKAKAGGKARYALFDAQLHTEVAHSLRLEGDLRRALGAEQLDVDYQPIFDLGAGKLIGFEALARWNHPVLGTISPMRFIAVAEDAGLMEPLTDFVLKTACGQLKQWQARDPRFAELAMHVNVSGSDVSQPGLTARIGAAIGQAQLAPRHLVLELTENILMARLEAALPALTELRRMGVGLSVDDFGTGYSSLRHLSSLPVNSLKIDRGFIADMLNGRNGTAIVSAIVQLGKSLGKTIVAEGIETDEQMQQLRRMGCPAGQGHFLSRPVAAGWIDKLLDGLAAPAEEPVQTSSTARSAETAESVY
jgi:diguanylate cyclase (GGDEF)-like protein